MKQKVQAEMQMAGNVTLGKQAVTRSFAFFLWPAKKKLLSSEIAACVPFSVLPPTTILIAYVRCGAALL